MHLAPGRAVRVEVHYRYAMNSATAATQPSAAERERSDLGPVPCVTAPTNINCCCITPLQHPCSCARARQKFENEFCACPTRERRSVRAVFALPFTSSTAVAAARDQAPL